jgi:hypothetical protein
LDFCHQLRPPPTTTPLGLGAAICVRVGNRLLLDAMGPAPGPEEPFPAAGSYQRGLARETADLVARYRWRGWPTLDLDHGVGTHVAPLRLLAREACRWS